MKTYRIELVYASGQKILWGYTSTTIEFIKSVMENNIKKHPVINVYSKTGKTIIDSFKG